MEDGNRQPKHCDKGVSGPRRQEVLDYTLHKCVLPPSVTGATGRSPHTLFPGGSEEEAEGTGASVTLQSFPSEWTSV